MVGQCCNTTSCSSDGVSPRYRKALWIALGINAVMFGVEVGGGLKSGSVSLLADAADFLADAANYGLSLTVLSLGLLWRARAALVKGLTMGAFGLFVLGKAGWNTLSGMPLEPITMGAIAFLALLANVGVALMLYTFRNGDANMRSVWLCSRNDAIGNVAVMLAAAGVFGTGQAWPDLVVAGIMGTLGLTSAVAVVQHAKRELASARGQLESKPTTSLNIDRVSP
jgi:Co/Zn/Cd efflux system component